MHSKAKSAASAREAEDAGGKAGVGAVRGGGRRRAFGFGFENALWAVAVAFQGCVLPGSWGNH